MQPRPPLPKPFAKPEYRLPQEGQLQLWLRSYAPFKIFGGGYEGDDRGPSTDTSVTARINYVLTFDFATMSRVETFTSSDESRGHGFLPRVLAYTTLHSSVDHQGVVRGVGTPSEDTVTHPVGKPGTGLALHTKLGGSNPLVGAAAAIDIQLNARLQKMWNGWLCVAGNVVGDAFPNCEVFLRDAAGDTAAIHSFRTRGGHGGPYAYLPGENFRIMGTFNKIIEMNPIGLIGLR